MTDVAAPTIGLTGGIASGKSTVSGFFAERGIPVVDADQLARQVVAPGTDGLAAVVDAFGDDVLLADGGLDRKRLGSIVFDDPRARRRLEAITHPRIAAAGAEAIQRLQADDPPYLLYDAALLVESDRHRLFPALLVVAARPETQVARLVARDGISEAEARRRVESQMPLEDKIEAATWVIWNEGTREDTRTRVAEVDREIRRRFNR